MSENRQQISRNLLIGGAIAVTAAAAFYFFRTRQENASQQQQEKSQSSTVNTTTTSTMTTRATTQQQAPPPKRATTATTKRTTATTPTNFSFDESTPQGRLNVMLRNLRSSTENPTSKNEASQWIEAQVDELGEADPIARATALHDAAVVSAVTHAQHLTHCTKLLAESVRLFKDVAKLAHNDERLLIATTSHCSMLLLNPNTRDEGMQLLMQLIDSREKKLMLLAAKEEEATGKQAGEKLSGRLAQLYAQAGFVLNKMGKFDQSLTSYNSALEIVSKIRALRQSGNNKVDPDESTTEGFLFTSDGRIATEYDYDEHLEDDEIGLRSLVGDILNLVQRHDEALEAKQAELQMRKDRHAADTSNTGNARAVAVSLFGGVARTLGMLQRHEEELKAFEESLNIWKAIYPNDGDGDAQYGHCMCTLGSALIVIRGEKATSDIIRGLELQRNGIALMRNEVRGRDDPALCSRLHALAGDLEQHGDKVEAQRLKQESIEMTDRLLMREAGQL